MIHNFQIKFIPLLLNKVFQIAFGYFIIPYTRSFIQNFRLITRILGIRPTKFKCLKWIDYGVNLMASFVIFRGCNVNRKCERAGGKRGGYISGMTVGEIFIGIKTQNAI